MYQTRNLSRILPYKARYDSIHRLNRSGVKHADRGDLAFINKNTLKPNT